MPQLSCRTQAHSSNMKPRLPNDIGVRLKKQPTASPDHIFFARPVLLTHPAAAAPAAATCAAVGTEDRTAASGAWGASAIWLPRRC